MTTLAILALRDDEGVQLGSLTLRCLPRAEDWRGMDTLEDRRGGPHEGLPGPSVRCLEETSYDYSIELNDGSITAVEPQELLSESADGMHRGRLQTGRSTGTVRVAVHSSSGKRGWCDLEVRSRKLDYESEFQHMLLRLAEEGAELLQSAFASSSQPAFAADQDTAAETLYQRFAFVQSFIESELFAEALEVIRHRPHSALLERHELVDPSHGCRPGPSLARQLTGPGERTAALHTRTRLRSLPREVERVIHEESFDTVPNQFVRFALEEWIGLAERIAQLLTGTSTADSRGRQEATYVAERLQLALLTPAIVDAGPLTRFPSSNTVLTGRAGYRELFRSYLLADVAASIDFEGSDDLFSAGQRDVAALYEYWVFLELARIVEELGFVVDRGPLLEVSKNGMSLNLRRGTECQLEARGERHGRRVTLELWFNRTFAPAKGDSWTVAMRPDCSILIRPDDLHSVGESTWLHFDAKYRIEAYTTLFGADADDIDDDDDGSEKQPSGLGRAKRDDLRKMHAYRDAIQRTSGAYVLYPGGDGDAKDAHRTYHEILPGLGAFVLRPTESGQASAASSGVLHSFLNDVISHTARQGSGRERAGYWERRSFSEAEAKPATASYDPQLRKPPADTAVLLGFAKSDAHREWIESSLLYNLRGDPSRNGSVALDGPQLRADVIVLYGTDDTVTAYRSTGALFLRSADELRAGGYPSPRGSNYLCVELGEQIDLEIDSDHVRELAGHSAAPAVCTWLDLVGDVAAGQLPD